MIKNINIESNILVHSSRFNRKLIFLLTISFKLVVRRIYALLATWRVCQKKSNYTPGDQDEKELYNDFAIFVQKICNRLCTRRFLINDHNPPQKLLMYFILG